MRIAIWQTGDALAALADAVLAAARRGARPIICPEAFTGYNVDAVGNLAQPADRPFARDVARVAQDAGVVVLYGDPPKGRPPFASASTSVAAAWLGFDAVVLGECGHGAG
jgi:predicted amidohydrolase